MGNLAMILTTEELSRASLAAAGSLITRPEILTKALMGGGTEEQKQQWLPKLASGEIMVGISVTEPGIGSNVAGARCKAERAVVDGEEGWLIDGPKAWCTFAGRANVLALLARTDSDLSLGAKGLSLFIVPKQSFTGHTFEDIQPGGGKLTGKADATPGYRGMHSYTLQFEKFFVPAENLVGRAGRRRPWVLPPDGWICSGATSNGRTSMRFGPGGTGRNRSLCGGPRAVRPASFAVPTHPVHPRADGREAGGGAGNHLCGCKSV